MPRLRLNTAVKTLLAELYGRSRRTVDDLPYTDEFEQMYADFTAPQRNDADAARLLEGFGRVP